MTYIIHEWDNISMSISKWVHIIWWDTFPTARFLITILVNWKLRNIFFEEKLQSSNNVYELSDWNRVHTIHDTLSSLW